MPVEKDILLGAEQILANLQYAIVNNTFQK
jgi:hypothetical protein